MHLEVGADFLDGWVCASVQRSSCRVISVKALSRAHTGTNCTSCSFTPRYFVHSQINKSPSFSHTFNICLILPVFLQNPLTGTRLCCRSVWRCVQYLLTYLHTYLLTPWSTFLSEKQTGLQLVKKFPAFYGTRKFITAFTSARHMSLSWARSTQSMAHPIPFPEDPS